MIHHHPDDVTLIGHAGGTLAGGAALLVATHLEQCATCRAAARGFEQVGTALMLEGEPVAPSPDALARLLDRLDAPPPASAVPPLRRRPGLPESMDWPRSLRHCHLSRWRPLGPGMRWCRVELPYDRAANVFLLRIAAGSCLPRHTHAGSELTQVLYGAFDDGRAIFAAGDFDATDASVHHQPVVQASGECICLAAVDGSLVFDGLLARLLGGLVGI